MVTDANATAGEGATGQPSIRLRDRRGVAVALALVAATTAVYWPILDNGFVNYDDSLYIVDNHKVRIGLSIESARWAFTTFDGANWFPLTWLSWMADIDLYGLEPRGFHLTSLVFHIANALLLFAAFARMTGALWPSAFVAAVFALHPLHVESVAWASARKDVISGAFWMLGLLAYAAYARRRSARTRGWGIAYALLLTSLALGLMAKPTLVVFPFALLLLDGWPLGRLGSAGRWDAAGIRRAVLEKLPLFALVGLAAGVTIVAQQSGGAIQSLERFSLQARLGNAVVSYVAYLGDAFWPSGLAVYYPHPLEALETWRIIGAFAALVTLSAIAWWARERWPHLATGWFWYVGVLVPVIGIVQVGQAARADRYTYLPLIGVSIALAWSGARLAARGRGNAIAVGGAAVLCLVAMSAATHHQASLWRDSTRLFEHALAVTERNHVAHINLGVVASNAGRWREAETHLRKALRIAPASATAHGVLGDALRGQEHPARALRHYRAALVYEPGSARWLEGLGAALLDQGRVDESIAALRRALRRKKSARLHESLGLALLRAGRHDEAIASFERVLRRRPGMAQAHGNLGVALLEDRQLDRAIEHLERALELRPDLALIRAYLGLALSGRDGAEAGLEQLDEVIRAEPDAAKYHLLAARLAERAGRRDEAIGHYRSVIDLGERAVGVLNNLAWLLVEPDAVAPAARDEAVALAEEAARLSEWRSATVLDTLALAYARASRWDEAESTAAVALQLAEEEGLPALAASLRPRLADYRRRRVP